MFTRILCLSAFVALLCFSYTPIGVNAQGTCGEFNATLLTNPREVCTPNYTAYTLSPANASVLTGYNWVKTQIDNVFRNFDIAMEIADIPVSRACARMYVAFFCSDYYPECTGNPYNEVRACSSACHALVDECEPFIPFWTNGSFTAMFPARSICDSEYSSSEHCTFSLDNGIVDFWYGEEGFVPTSSPTPTPTPTRAPRDLEAERARLYPGGGPLKGGLLAAGLLVGLLLLVGGIGLFMKRQERK